MPRSSHRSAGATYLDRDRRIGDLRAAAQRAQARLPGVLRVVLFGSLARGSATPRSDADLLVIVDHSPHAEPRDRLPELLAAMAPLPGPVDAFILTRAEFDRARADSAPLVREALNVGIDLLPTGTMSPDGS